MVVDLITVVKLTLVELFDTCNGVDSVNAFDGAGFIFVGVAPWNRFIPVEVGLDGISLAVFLDFEFFVAAVCGVGEA